jgi:periplasmic divalent cation tolerance protein
MAILSSVAVGFADAKRLFSPDGMADQILLALSTFPDADAARRISHQLVADKFVACANILPGIESIYSWKEKIEAANETLVLFKLAQERVAAFQEKLRLLHPYEVPEIIWLKIEDGLPAYLNWVAEASRDV